jgi:hypothetical protein
VDDSQFCLTYALDMSIFADERFLGLVSKDFIEAINDLAPAIADLSEPELKSMVKPTPIDYALKTSFWREYSKCEAAGGVVTSRDVYGGIATPKYFKSMIIENPFKLAWLCRPTQVYEKEVEALLNRGTERLWELLEMDMYKADGSLDTRCGYLVLDVIKMVEQRAKGLAVQRVQSVNVNIDSPRQMIQGSSSKELDERIKELEAELVRLPAKQDVIDVYSGEEGILEAVGVEKETAGDAAPLIRLRQIPVAD